MNTAHKLTFAPYVAAACALWIVAAATGSQGFTAIIGLLAIASLFFARPSLQLPAYGWALIASLVWITLSSLWSPAGGSWISGSLTGEDFSIDVASIRLIGAVIFCALAVGAATKIPAGRAEKSNSAILIIVGLLGAFIVGVFVFRSAILEFAYPEQPEKAMSDGVQNMQRAANSVSVLLPVGLAAAWHRFTAPSSRIAMAATGVVMLVVFQLLGSQSAVMSFLLMLAAFASVRWLGVGAKSLLRLIAGYILFAPALMFAGTRVIETLSVRLPESFQARVFCWQETITKIAERPFSGHGLEASGTWQKTYAGHPEWLETLTGLAAEGQADAMNSAWQNYPIIPGHPHNMALELWAEAGMIGALLVASAFWMVAGKVDYSTSEDRTLAYVSTGLIGAALPLFSFAYSAWNEAYWGMIAIAICAAIVVSKRASA